MCIDCMKITWYIVLCNYVILLDLYHYYLIHKLTYSKILSLHAYIYISFFIILTKNSTHWISLNKILECVIFLFFSHVLFRLIYLGKIVWIFNEHMGWRAHGHFETTNEYIALHARWTAVRRIIHMSTCVYPLISRLLHKFM